MSDVTRVLQAIDEGDPTAARELLPLVYSELRQLAEHRMAEERSDHTLQPTALVHEAYMRLIGNGNGLEVSWDGRGHFFAAAAEAMRRVLVDHARARGALKRGGGLLRLSLDAAANGDTPDASILDLDQALDRLADEDPTKAELVKLRFFAGLTLRQAADVLNISRATASRYWAYSRAWLFDEINQDSGDA